MRVYYCKNCNNKVGIFCDIKKCYIKNGFYTTISEHDELLYFLDCEICRKFIGIKCIKVCVNCFGKHILFSEEKLKKLFIKYKKIKPKYINCKYCCIICNTNNFRSQYWFFGELTFYKKKI